MAPTFLIAGIIAAVVFFVIHNLTTITAKRICSSKPQFAILERHTDVINQRDEVVLSYDSVVMIKTKRDDKPDD